METVYLSLGTNIGDGLKNLKQAIGKLKEAGLEITSASSVYRTQPVGGIKQDDFFNMCLSAATSLSPVELLMLAKKVEQDMGRAKSVKWGPRIIDIDIIFYGKIMITSDELVIPHPQRQSRMFVMEPLSEIAPDLIDPETKMNILDMKNSLTNAGRCERIGKIDE